MLEAHGHWNSPHCTGDSLQFCLTWERWSKHYHCNVLLVIKCMDFLAHPLIRAILAVHLSITYPLIQQTLLALRTAALRAAWRRFSAVLLVWMISAVRVSITAHTDRNARTAAAPPFSYAAALLTCRPGRVIPLERKFMFLIFYFHNLAVALYWKADLRYRNIMQNGPVLL